MIYMFSVLCNSDLLTATPALHSGLLISIFTLTSERVTMQRTSPSAGFFLVVATEQCDHLQFTLPHGFPSFRPLCAEGRERSVKLNLC